GRTRSPRTCLGASSPCELPPRCPPMFHADLAAARRLEAVEARQFRNFTETLARLRPERGVAIEPIGGGWAVYHGPGSPLNEAKGLGMDGPVSDDDLDRLDAFFRDRG